jgi:hypothetical protein
MGPVVEVLRAGDQLDHFGRRSLEFLFCGTAAGIISVAEGSCYASPQASSASFSIIAPSASMPAARQKRSKLADTSSQALPTAPEVVGGKTVEAVLNLVMALLSFAGIITQSLQAQGEQRRFSFFNIQRGIPLPNTRRIS